MPDCSYLTALSIKTKAFTAEMAEIAEMKKV